MKILGEKLNQKDFPEDFELQAVSLEELEQERAIDVEVDQRSEDYYLRPETPLYFG